MKYREIKLLPLKHGESAKLALHPAKGFDLGEGKGKVVNTTVHGGTVGLVIDCRGRPFRLPDDKNKRMELLNTWFDAMNLYPKG